MDPLLMTFALILSVILLSFIYLVKNFTYWKNRGVNGPKPKLFYGTFPSLINHQRHIIYDMEEIYYKYKETDNVVGVFTIQQPQLLIISPTIIHEILVNKFKHFTDNAVGYWVNRKYDKMISNNPFLLSGERWKEKRSEITPALTTNRIKTAFPAMQQICEKMTNYIQVFHKNTYVDVNNLCKRFTAEIVSDCIYGIQSHSFDRQELSPIYLAADKMFKDFDNGFSKNFVANVIPFIKWFHTIRFFSNETENFFSNLMKNAIQLHKECMQPRMNFINYLLELKEKKHLTDLDIVSHSLTFFLDGYETSATLMSHCLLMLARNPVEQQRLREEIQMNLQEGLLTFEKISEMEYLDMCINETLRILTPLLFASKVCTSPVQLDNGNGKMININVGDVLHLPFLCIHNDDEYFPNPQKFIPERFSKQNGGVKKLKDEGKFLPFGDGPRICLGMKFALVQTKAFICEVIRNFEILPHARTQKENFFTNSQGIISVFNGGIFINFKKLIDD